MATKWTEETFRVKAMATHGAEYDYPQANFLRASTKVKIVCRKPGHGVFEQRPDGHVRGARCPAGVGELPRQSNLLTQKEYICRAIKKWGDRIDYSHTIYRGSDHPITIGCEVHGLVEVQAGAHIHGTTCCPKCGKERQREKVRGKTICRRGVPYELFARRGHDKFGPRFTYDASSYSRMRNKVWIHCNIHGWFHRRAFVHLNSKHGCLECSKRAAKILNSRSGDDFIKMAREVHQDRYGYGNCHYNNQRIEVSITCRKHGDFPMLPYAHLRGQGCRKCKDEERRLTQGEFKVQAGAKHDNKYSYDCTNFTVSRETVEIRCPEHGLFTQRASDHLAGDGCPQCNSSKGEALIRRLLLQQNIAFKEQWQDHDCLFNSGRRARFDFHIPAQRLLIEYDGIQHSVPVEHFGGADAFEQTRYRDAFKDSWARLNNYTLIRLPSGCKIQEALSDALRIGTS